MRHWIFSWPGLWLVAAWALGWSGQASCAETVRAAGLKLRWEVVANRTGPDAPQGRSMARFTFSKLATPSRPAGALPQGAWALYFNSIAGVADGQPGVEHVNGTLFRIRSRQDLAALPPDGVVSLDVEHPELMVRADKAPTGPYLVFDSAPEVAYAIHDYQRLPFPRSQQLAGVPAGFSSLISSADLYAQNVAIVDVPVDELPPVLPSPFQVKRASGTLHWAARPEVVAPAALAGEAKTLQALLDQAFASSASASSGRVRLAIAPLAGVSSPEAYRLEVDPQAGITLTGNTAEGVFRGVQSLRQMLTAGAKAQGGMDLPAMTILDEPRFAYRGLLVDVARNFQDKTTVFRLIDLMAAFKLNKLHLHLADDEGWRLQIKRLPELTGIGARRGHSAAWTDRLPPAYGSGPDARDPHGSGFYSQDDYVALLRYARDRHVEVIPELEMPGHARAAVKAMEARYRKLKRQGLAQADAFLLSDPADRSTYSSAQLYNDNVVNPGLPSTYTFIETVVGEIVAMHRRAGVPLRTLHVGADELAEGAWERSPAARQTMQRLGLATTADLWDVFYDRVDRILRKHGLQAAGWEELGARRVKVGNASALMPNPKFVGRNFLLMVWNNLEGSEDLAYRLANAGYAVVLAPATNFYFDMAHNVDALEPGVNWAAPVGVELADVHGFDPYNFAASHGGERRMEALSESGRKNIVGLEAAMFSETLREPARIEYLLMPRLLGLAERAWAPAPAWGHASSADAARLRGADWSRFSTLLGRRTLPFLDAAWPELNYRLPAAGLQLKDGKVWVNYPFPGVALRYTTDGSEPLVTSPLVDGPIAAHGLVKVAAFSRHGRSGPVSSLDNR